MKLSFIVLLAAIASEAVSSPATISPSSTAIPEISSSTITQGPILEKRARKVIINKEQQKLEEQKEALANGEDISTTDQPKPWRRTIYGSIVEIVKPTVIAGVTFSAKPPATTDGLEKWVSLKKDGSPKTIQPKNKGGVIKDKKPDYGTWFATATTIHHNKEDLKAHNMQDDEIFSEETHIEEDDTYQKLNPLIRCTPERYFKKGAARNQKSEPFCTPQDNQSLKMDSTYFVTWFSKFFGDEVENVRIHLSSIKVAANDHGFKKRSEIIDNGGKIQKKSFYVSDWVSKDKGFEPITILDEWLGKDIFFKKISISIQPDNIPDDEYDLLDKYVVVEIKRGTTVAKGTHLDLKKLEEKQRLKQLGIEVEDDDYLDKYYIILGMPTCVMIVALAMYIFVWINKKDTDLSWLKRKKAAGKNTKHRRLIWKGSKKSGYSELPSHSKDIEMENVGKMD
ncbi:PMA1 stabilization in the Golgi protein 1 [[Candida] railenensis]|uniref:PMA1 stabilization in the Golgi protein 1 n=1 Tax=[Candida] railenensis TaxID=45579 RepID=A0A9P0QP24_9ASCO|nr:PMA1 stabilization in the Golgi protein 1 [[Candida] railenensis]